MAFDRGRTAPEPAPQKYTVVRKLTAGDDSWEFEPGATVTATDLGGPGLSRAIAVGAVTPFVPAPTPVTPAEEELDG